MKSEDEHKKTNDESDISSLTRRGFLKVVGVFAIGATGAGLASCEYAGDASKGYIVVDTKKCQGCLTCMISCSLVNEGIVNLSLSRIQIIQNTLGCYPDNIQIAQCRQCEDPRCVDACPVGALIIDKQHGNIRLVNTKDCVGCGRCVMACPYQPKRPVVAPDARFGGELKSRKCDLCLSAPHHLCPEGGGINGVRACETMCPLGAIQFVTKIGGEGYDVNLRGFTWALMGYDAK